MISKPRIFHISNNFAAAPHFPIRAGLKTVASEYREIAWTDYLTKTHDANRLEHDIQKCFGEFKPDIVFMQLQGDGILRDQLIANMAQKSFVCSFTGDVRSDIGWYERAGKFIDTTLFTNCTDVQKMLSKNLKADYLQVGYDHNIYKPTGDRTSGLDGIVFLGNNYIKHLNFPLSKLRHDMVEKLWKEFSSGRKKPLFNFYGNGWDDTDVGSYYLTPEEEANCYRSCDIAINLSHFDYSRYSSDRMLRIMGCGALCMTHHFDDIEKDYIDGKNVIVWNDLDDLVDKCKFWMQPKQLHKRKNIARAGYELVSKKATWEVRAKELMTIVKKYR